MDNPFQYGRELGISELVDRYDELNQVTATIQQGGKLFLIGPRRYGKTSILKVAEDKLVADGAVVLRYDAESYPSLDLLVSAIVSGVAKTLKGGIERAGEQLQKFFAKLRPELSFSVTDQEWSVKLGVREEHLGNHLRHLNLLIEALDGLERLARSQSDRQPVGLIIDEFQKVIELGGQSAESQIRAAIQRHKRTGYVFAGSKTHLLTAMTMDAARPFYRLGSLCFLGPVPRQDFIVFLREKFLKSGFSLVSKDDNESLSRILDLAEDVPYNVQMLAYACWEQLRTGGASKGKILNGTVVEQSLDRLVRQYDPFYTQLWNDLTSIQQKVLLAVIAERGANLQSMKVVRMVGRGTSTTQRSIGLLIDHAILREEEHRGATRVRFEDPFFSQWIGRFTVRL
ncbi:MAG: AAA family ATPase [Acidobacteriota bacterium]|nr:AAA family ATPase [Acidobacteriota bacterium]